LRVKLPDESWVEGKASRGDSRVEGLLPYMMSYSIPREGWKILLPDSSSSSEKVSTYRVEQRQSKHYNNLTG